MPNDWYAFVRARLPALRCPPACEAEIVEEIAIQLESVYRAARAGGASENEAYARVVDEVPDWPELAAALVASKYPRTAAARQMTDAHVASFVARQPFAPSVTTVIRELTYAARALAASPVFAFAVTVTLALGIGATTAVFSLVNAVLLAPLPFRDTSRLAVVQQIVPEIAERYPVLGANPRSIQAWTNACRTTCEKFAVLAGTTGTLTGAGEPEGLVGARVSPNFFAVLGLPLLVGREFTQTEDQPGADAVVVLSHMLWSRRFGSDRSVVGRMIDLDGKRTQVVGVLAASVGLGRLEDLSEVRFQTGVPEFFRPLAWTQELLRSPGEYDNTAIVRMTGTATPTQVAAELDAITEAEFRAAPVHPRTRVRPMRDQILGPWRRPLVLLLASVLAALAIGCVNVANLLGGRWIGRRRELAIRSAMGADGGDLLRLVASETFLLAAAGGAAGLLVAWTGLRTLIHLAPPGIPRLESVRLDAAGFGFAVVTALCCGIVCSLLPARQVLRGETGETLKAGAHTTTGGPGAAAVRGSLVGAEIALTSALLVLGGLLVLSLHNVLRVDPGFQTARVLAVDLKLPQARYPESASRARFFEALLLRVQSAPGVEAAGIIRVLPLEGETTVDTVAAVGDTRPIVELQVANHLQVSPGYFRALGLPLVAGRWLTADDYGRNVALVSERTARLVWPNQNPLGQRFTRSNRNRDWEVVGLVADARLRGLDQQAGLATYVPYWTGTASDFSLAVRTYGEPETAFGAVRHAVAALDPQMPLQRVRTMEAVLESTLATRRFQMRMMLAFAGAGLLLACLGVYSVVSAGVEGRTREFAVRLALGATSTNIVRAVLSDALRPLVAGLVLGVALGMGAAATLASLLFEVAPYEPVVILGTVTVILGMGLAACLAPATRATRTDPMMVLRQT